MRIGRTVICAGAVVGLLAAGTHAQQTEACDRIVEQLVSASEKHEQQVTEAARAMEGQANDTARAASLRRLCGAYGRASGHLEIMTIAGRECLTLAPSGRDLLASIESAASEFRENLPQHCP